MTSAASLPSSLLRLLQKAERRRRIARLKQALGVIGIGLAGLAVGVGIAVLFQPGWIEALPLFGVGMGVIVASIVGFAWFRPVHQRALLRELDERLELPDSLLSAAELAGAKDANPDHPWLEAQQSAAIEAAKARTTARGWRSLWPAPWPKGSAHSLLVLVVLLPLFTWLYGIHGTINYEGAAGEGNRHRAAALEQLFEDWEKYARQEETPEALEALLAEIAPLRERLADPHASEEQVFADLNRLEEAVAARRAELAAQSLEPHAASIADALESIEGMSAMAAALRRGDFEAALQQAETQQEALAQEAGEMPKGAEESADKMEQAGNQLEQAKQQQAGEGMKEMAEGARNQQRSEMAKGMEKLQQSIAGQCRSRGEGQRLSAQLAQLAAMKAAIGEGQMPGSEGLSSMLGQSQQGKSEGVGEGSDPNLFGEATDPVVSHQEERLTGQVGEGESEVTTTQSQSGGGKSARGDGAPAPFQTYEQLSRQAIEDETIPAGHRQSIKSYFERIRPQSR